MEQQEGQEQREQREQEGEPANVLQVSEQGEGETEDGARRAHIEWLRTWMQIDYTP